MTLLKNLEWFPIILNILNSLTRPYIHNLALVIFPIPLPGILFHHIFQFYSDIYSNVASLKRFSLTTSSEVDNLTSPPVTTTLTCFIFLTVLKLFGILSKAIWNYHCLLWISLYQNEIMRAGSCLSYSPLYSQHLKQCSRQVFNICQVNEEISENGAALGGLP